MRILHVISSVDPNGGGPIEGVKSSSHVLKEQGHVLEVVSLDDPSASHAVSFPLPLHALGPARFNYAYAPGLVTWLRRHASRYDAVIVNGIWQFHALAVWRALRRSRTPYFVFTHGMLDPWFKHAYPLKHLKKSLYWPLAEYQVLRDARGVCFTCEEERVLHGNRFVLINAERLWFPMAQRVQAVMQNPNAQSSSSVFLICAINHSRYFWGVYIPKKAAIY